MQIEKEIQELRKSRGWDKSDTPAILAKSVFIEASELLECFRWNDDEFDPNAVQSEVADILMYAISLCMDLGIDYQEVIRSKFADVERRYPTQEAVQAD